jgi:hypothetical protein
MRDAIALDQSAASDWRYPCFFEANMNPHYADKNANVGGNELAGSHRPVEGAPTVPAPGKSSEADLRSTRAREDCTLTRSFMLDPDTDEVRLLIRLGAAVSLLWPSLPKSLRDQIHEQASCVVLPPAYGEPKHIGAYDELNVWLESCRLKHF